MSPSSDVAAREELRPFWPIFLALGGLLVLAGFLALLMPSFIAQFAVILWGWFLVARGCVDVAGSFFARRQSSFLSHLIMGILALVVGMIILSYVREDETEKVEKVILLLIAVFLLVSGLAQILSGLALRSEGWLFVLLAGLVSVIVGVFVWRNVGNPQKTPYILGIFVALDLLSRGATWIGLGLVAKNAKPAFDNTSSMPGVVVARDRHPPHGTTGGAP